MVTILLLYIFLLHALQGVLAWGSLSVSLPALPFIKGGEGRCVRALAYECIFSTLDMMQTSVP